MVNIEIQHYKDVRWDVVVHDRECSHVVAIEAAGVRIMQFQPGDVDAKLKAACIVEAHASAMENDTDGVVDALSYPGKDWTLKPASEGISALTIYCENEVVTLIEPSLSIANDLGEYLVNLKSIANHVPRMTSH